ncbi:MAG: glycosyltransferase family protein [Pseudomonadota bacterium]
MTTVAIIQARMGSTRLPGKVLMDLAGQPMLARVVSRTLRATRVDKVVVATSKLAADDAIAKLCSDRGWACFRGDETDVLDRYWRAAQEHRADLVVRITSDCPLIDPELVDQVVNLLLSASETDYASNIVEPRSFPRGLDCEAFRIDALHRAWREGQLPVYREHVTTYLWQHPDKFTVRGLYGDEDHSAERWTVDTPEDLALVRAVYEADPQGRWPWREVRRYLTQHPNVRELNRLVRQRHL